MSEKNIESGLTGIEGTGRGEVCRRFVEQILSSVELEHGRGAAPAALLAWTSDEFDRLLAALFEASRIPGASLICLVALGGYGRGELYPRSDLDLLVLHPEEEAPLAARLVEELVYPLWDARVSVGHASRTIEETLELAQEDLTMRTSLLDARIIAGDEGLFHALEAGALREFFGPQRVGEFVAALQDERRRRHRRFGETEYLLEPNVKNSKGGLRDLNAGLWAAKARFGVEEIGQIPAATSATFISDRALKALESSQEFLRRLRLLMHLRAGRAQDHLRFEVQESVAPEVFPEVALPGKRSRKIAGVEPAVERLMHAFYRHARTVVIETDGILERCGETGEDAPSTGLPVSSRSDEHFHVVDRRIHSVRPERFWEEPAEIMRSFEEVLERGHPLSRETRDVLAEAVADSPGAQLKVDGAASRSWFELLCSAERSDERTVLEEMHHLGVIGVLIPEFEPCTGRIQHDLYHVYTVDMHSIYVVALLKAWRRGEHGDVNPTPVSVMERQQRPGLDALMLAALLHDVGKPLGHGHAAKGARLAAGVAARLGLAEPLQRDVVFLVEHHLVMAHISQRRDLADPAVIETFARLVGSTTRLRMLYLLTMADTAVTAPGNLDEWKTSLMDELYLTTFAHLDLGGEEFRRRRDSDLMTNRDTVELSLRRRWGRGGADLIERVPDEMILSFEVSELEHHLGVAAQLESEPGAILRLESRSRGDSTTELTLCCSDAPGLLATITGVMLAHHVQVLGAQVYTLAGQGGRAGDPGARILDIFMVQGPRDGDAQTWSALSRDLELALRGELSVADLVQRHTRPSNLARKVLPAVEIRVAVDNDVSEQFSVIEIQAPDRLGVLHAITKALSHHGLVIHLSKVATEAGRVVDNFYVSDGGAGGKVTDEERLERLRECVVAAIEDLI